MRYDDDRYFDDEEDRDLWDDELELTTDPPHEDRGDTYVQSFDPSVSYDPYGDTPDHTHDDSDEAKEDDYYSDPVPEAPVKPRRERLFGKRDEADDDNDYFDSDSEAVPLPAPKHKTPKLDPEDPDYWIEEENSPLSGIISGSKGKWKWKLTGIIAIIVLLAGGWIWFFRPYADGTVKYGYIKDMERRGSVFKTFEGTMIPYKELGDPDPLYFQEIRFSVAGDSLAARMKRMMLGCVPVRVEYDTYRSPLPWKGEQKMIIVKADTADPRKILPPEYRYK